MYLSKEIIFELGFPMGMSRDKGTTGQAQNLATGQDRTAYQYPGRDLGRDDHYFSVKIRDGTGTGQSLFFPMISCFRTFFAVLERPFPLLVHPLLF